MNILMVTADHLMIDRRILQEAKSLVEQGHKVILLAGFECAQRESYYLDGIQVERFMYDWSDSRFVSIVRRFSWLKTPKIYAFAWKLFRFWANNMAKINSFEQFVLDRMMEYQVDILHVHDFPMLYPGVILSKVRLVPLIYDAHELYYAQTQLSPQIQKKYMRLEEKLIPYAKVVITVNPYIAVIMAERYKIPLPRVILNAAIWQEKVMVNELRERFGLPQHKKVVLYQGWISPNRGIEHLVDAAEYFDTDICLIIIGYGDFELELKKQVAEKNLSDRVYFYGGVPSAELHPLTCSADLGIIPYHGVDENNYYCSPNKLFEFMVSGLPIIANNLPFLSDIIGKYKNGILVDLSSPQKLATEINRILTNREALDHLRLRAEQAGKDLNWQDEQQKLLAIYKEIEAL